MTRPRSEPTRATPPQATEQPRETIRTHEATPTLTSFNNDTFSRGLAQIPNDKTSPADNIPSRETEFSTDVALPSGFSIVLKRGTSLTAVSALQHVRSSLRDILLRDANGGAVSARDALSGFGTTKTTTQDVYISGPATIPGVISLTGRFDIFRG